MLPSINDNKMSKFKKKKKEPQNIRQKDRKSLKRAQDVHDHFTQVGGNE